MANRRFPSPWSVEDIAAAFLVKDATAQKRSVEQYKIVTRT